MWYFAWLLGLPFAAAFAVLNAMWYELVEDDESRENGREGVSKGIPRHMIR